MITRDFNNRNLFRNFKRTVFTCIFSVSLMTGCNDEAFEQPDSIAVKGSTDAIQTYEFDWENVDYMPTVPGRSYSIQVPWAAGIPGSIISSYSSDVWSDYKKADGWELLYNTFNPNKSETYLYFVLYNKYRGLIRIYFFNENTGYTYSSKILTGLSWQGNGNGSNKTLAFVGKSIVDYQESPLTYSAFEPTPLDNNQNPVAPKKWYMMQFDVAYDPTITPISTNPYPILSFYMNFYNITELSLGGTLQGDITGTVGATALKDQLSSALTGAAKNLGTVGVSAIGTRFFDSNKMNLPTNVYNAMKSGVTSALSKSAGSIPGTIINILSATFGGNSSSSGQAVQLNLNAKLTLKGTATNSGSLLPSTPLPMPGSLANNGSGVRGYIPVKNIPLGVFNISNTPTVIKDVQDNWAITGTYEGEKYNTFSFIDFSSFHIKWNPEVLKYATIKNVKYDLIVSNFNSLDPHNGQEYLFNGTNWYNLYVGRNSMGVFLKQCDNYNDAFAPMIRISFNVVPKDGGPIVTIVKTFKAKNVYRFGADSLW